MSVARFEIYSVLGLVNQGKEKRKAYRTGDGVHVADPVLALNDRKDAVVNGDSHSVVDPFSEFIIIVLDEHPPSPLGVQDGSEGRRAMALR